MLSDEWGAYQLRSDVIRKQSLGLSAQAKTNSRINQDAYDPKITSETYNKLAQHANTIVKAGYSVIVDAAFLKASQRQQFYQLAQQLKIPVQILNCHAPEEQLVRSLKLRQANAHEASEAGLEVLKMQQQTMEPLTEAEKARSIFIETGHYSDLYLNKENQALKAQLIKSIQQQIQERQKEKV